MRIPCTRKCRAVLFRYTSYHMSLMNILASTKAGQKLFQPILKRKNARY